MAENGVDCLLKANVGTEATPDYQVVAAQRGAELSRSADTLDSTSKDSGGWKENDASFRTWGLSGDGLYVFDDAAYTALEDAFDAGNKIMVQVAEGNGTIREGTGVITDFPLNFSYEEKATYSFEITGSGALTKV